MSSPIWRRCDELTRTCSARGFHRSIFPATRSREASAASHRYLADIQWRLLGTPLQPAHANQREERPQPRAHMGLSRRFRARTESIWSTDQGNTAADQWRSVLHHAGSCLGDRRPYRRPALAFQVEDHWRNPHRESRSRYLWRLAVL